MQSSGLTTCQPVCPAVHAHTHTQTRTFQELGWTIFLMLVKGHIPKLSLGVSNQLLPLMQVEYVVVLKRLLSRYPCRHSSTFSLFPDTIKCPRRPTRISALFQPSVCCCISLLASSVSVCTPLFFHFLFLSNRLTPSGLRILTAAVNCYARARVLLLFCCVPGPGHVSDGSQRPVPGRYRQRQEPAVGF